MKMIFIIQEIALVVICSNSIQTAEMDSRVSITLEQFTALRRRIDLMEKKQSSTESDISRLNSYVQAFQKFTERHVKVEKALNEEQDSVDEGISHLRLVGSSSADRGRVEVMYKGVWGTICRRSWDNSDATVVCRQLGFRFGFPAYTASGLFTPGEGYIWMDRVRCTGNETNLNQCPFQGWGNVHPDCRHSRDAGVLCSNSEDEDISYLRLVGYSSADRGRVEVMYKGVWGTICRRSWDNKDATVVCRQLGFRFGYPAYNASRFFSLGEGYKWMDRVKCTGNETNLNQCPFQGWGNVHPGCGHSLDAGVLCSNSIDQSFSAIRLVGHPSDDRGRLELMYSGIWGTVCDDGWDNNAATVACKQLGFRSGTAKTGAYFGRGTGKIWMNNVHCRGMETRLDECQFEGVGNHYCGHHEDAGVICSN